MMASYLYKRAAIFSTIMTIFGNMKTRFPFIIFIIPSGLLIGFGAPGTLALRR